MPERPGFSPDAQGPLRPFELPPELADYLRGQEMVCMMQPTDQGTAFVVKLPIYEIVSLRGVLPIHIAHELWLPPQAPVIRTQLRFFDRPDSYFDLETFTNIADPVQAQDFAALTHQQRAVMLFYDEHVSHQLTKLVSHRQGEHALRLFHQAQLYRSSIPAAQFDFDTAKRAVMAATQLGK